MSSKYGFIFSALLLLFFSCSRKEQFPELKSTRITNEKVTVTKSFIAKVNQAEDSTINTGLGNNLTGLVQMKQYFTEHDKGFNLETFEKEWAGLDISLIQLNAKEVHDWIDCTGLLFELTGKAGYAETLEQLIDDRGYSINSESDKLLKSLVFTKNVDHIHVNLFTNASVKYEHTLKGAVEITEETNYPESGKVTIKFKMGEKRYIELFIRIPSWAEGATVIEKGVKYVAPPGGYSQVVRKWSDGDFIEINLPIEQMPKR